MKQGIIEVSEVGFKVDDSIQITAPSEDTLQVVERIPSNDEYYISSLDVFRKFVRIPTQNGQTVDVFFPSNSTVTCPLGTLVTIENNGPGTIVIKAGPGAVVNTPQSLLIDKQNGRAILIKTLTDEWEIDGRLFATSQIFIFDINPTIGNIGLNVETFDEPISTDIVNTNVTINSNEIYQYTSYLNNYVDINTYGDYTGSLLFSNKEPVGKYFKLTVISGVGTFLDEPFTGNNYAYYTPGEWVQYLQPSPNNNYLTYKTNPKYKIRREYSAQTPIELLFEVSNTSDNSGIIGSFRTTLKPYFIDTFKTTFAYSSSLNYFYLNPRGEIYESATGTVNSDHFYDPNNDITTDRIGSLTLNPDQSVSIDPSQSYGLYFRVTDQSGLNNHNGTGVVGTIYTFYPYDLKNITFGRNSNGTTTYLFEILKDTGTLEVFFSGTITLL